jgi:hypothetical protein
MKTKWNGNVTLVMEKESEMKWNERNENENEVKTENGFNGKNKMRWIVKNESKLKRIEARPK